MVVLVVLLGVDVLHINILLVVVARLCIGCIPLCLLWGSLRGLLVGALSSVRGLLLGIARLPASLILAVITCNVG